MHAHKSHDIMTVILHNYHDGEYPFDRMTYATAAHVRYVWDHNLQELAEMAFPSKDWTDTSDEAQALFEKFLEGQLSGLSIELNEKHDAIQQTIFVVSGTCERVYSAFEAYAYALMDDVQQGGPGADDGTYDYFPGAVEVCLQLAAAFEEVDYRPQAARALYNQLVHVARESHYEGNEEVDDLLPILGG